MSPHGTRARYNSGCKCDACRAAAAEWRAKRRAAKADVFDKRPILRDLMRKAAENIAYVKIPGEGWVEVRLPEMDKETLTCR